QPGSSASPAGDPAGRPAAHASEHWNRRVRVRASDGGEAGKAAQGSGTGGMIALPVAIGFRLLSLFGVKDALAKKLAPLAAVVLGLLLVAAGILAFNWWLGNQREAAVEADRAKSSAEAASRARQADEAAQRAS